MKRRKLQILLILFVFITALYVLSGMVRREVEFAIPVDSSVNELFVTVQPAVPTFDGRKVDSVYDKIAKATGGSLFVMDKNSDSVVPMNASFYTEVVMVSKAKLVAGDSPIVLNLYSPSGEELPVKQEGVESTNLNSGKVISIKSPKVGIWKAKVTGSNEVSIKVTAKTNIYILDAKLVELGGRTGHQGYFQKDDQTPYSGKKEMLEITISKGSSIIPENDHNISNLKFAFISEDGKVLRYLENMQPENSRGEDFFGEVTIPDKNFMIAMLGTDDKGIAFQRNFAPLFEPKK